jgi:tetratricopeptide (TPR) repeat protein
VWRTGANNATTLTFGDEVTIGGTKIPAGKYGLLSIPDKRNWTLIITKQLDVTSPAAYKQDQDVVRVEVKAMDMIESVESLTMPFANVKPNSCELHIMWDKTAVTLPISTEVESKVMAQIDQAMNKDSRPYYSAALYYMDNGKDLNQALSWFDKAVELQPNAFWIHHQRANCLAKLGKKADAKLAAEKSKQLATEQKNDDYVKLNEKLLADLGK